MINDVCPIIKTYSNAQEILKYSEFLISSNIVDASNISTDFISKNVPHYFSSILYELLSILNLSYYDKSSFASLQATLKSILKNVNLVYVTLPMDFDVYFLDEIFNIISHKVSEPFLIDYKVDKNIIAGCIISYKGFFQDYSVSYKLNKFFANGVDFYNIGSANKL